MQEKEEITADYLHSIYLLFGKTAFHFKNEGIFTWIKSPNMLYRVLKVGYLTLGGLSNQFKVPVNGCWKSKGHSSNHKCRFLEGVINAREKGFYVN